MTEDQITETVWQLQTGSSSLRRLCFTSIEW